MTTKLETYAISHENSSNELIRETPYSAQETVNSQQLAILKKNFPSCFDKNGAFLPNKLAELVGAETEVSQEFYELNWLGRSYAKYLRNAPPEMLMTEDTEHNAEPINQDSQNLLIQGDNLEVLKHLKNAYSNQIKMIYIDPPYNTGSDGFVYPDDRKFTPQQLSELANVPIEEAERILAFTAKGSNSHSAWLTFMYPRLYVARELLKDDGVIFISIDDNEQAQLKLLCDDVFGEQNFIGELTWEKKKKGTFLSNDITNVKESILVYSKDKVHFNGLIGEINHSIETYPCINASNKKEIRTIKKGIKSKYRESNYFLPKGSEISDTTMSLKLLSDLKIENNVLMDDLIIEGNWRYTQDSLDEYHSKNNLYVTQDLYIRRIVDEPRHKTLKDLLLREGTNNELGYTNFNSENLFEDGWGSNEDADEELRILLGKQGVFSNPKPTKLLRKLITSVRDKEMIVLDFFAGSGTTAHAILKNNAALESNAKYTFISVQIAEDLDESLKKAPTNLKANIQNAIDYLDSINKPHNIFEITKERIIRASQKILEENPEVKGDFGFKIYKTTPQLINHNLSFDLNQPELPELLELKPDDYLALLTTWRLYDGAKLTEKVTDIDLDGYTAHLCQQNLYLMYPDFQPKHLIQLIKLLDNDPSFTLNRVVMLGETIDSSRQNEIYQALKDYANKKSLDLSVIVRNI